MDDGQVDETISRLLVDLESLGPEDALLESSVVDLQFLVSSFSSATSNRDAAFPLWLHLAEAGLSHLSLLRPLSSSMDLPSPESSLLAARVYLSLILTPSAPVLSLFSPIAFLSLLRALRRALKPLPTPPQVDLRQKRKRKRSRVSGDNRADDQLPSADAGAGDLLPVILDLLDSVLSRVHLQPSPDCVKSLIDTIASVLSSSVAELYRLSDRCLRIIYSTISYAEEGDQTSVAVDVLKSVAPAILSSPPKSSLRVAILGFITNKIAPLARKNEKVLKALVYFPRYLASKAPERAEPRAAAVDAIMDVVRALKEEDQIAFSEYVVKMAQGKSQQRLLAVDLILCLSTSLPDPLGADESVEIANCWGVKCLKALLLRCLDSMGGVRARALTNMSQVIEFLSRNARNSVRLQEGLAFCNIKFNELLKKRCFDDKAVVRKAALLLIIRCTSLIGRSIDEEMLKTIGFACMDPLVSIRKAAMSAISEVYRQFPDERIIMEWLHTVPRLILDNETSIQEECENLFLELVLDQISNASPSAKDCEFVIPERILALLKGICDGEVLPCVRKICSSLGKKKKLKASIVASLQKVISVSESEQQKKNLPIESWAAPLGAWQLISEVSLFTPKAIEWKFLHHHWKLLDKCKVEGKGKKLDAQEPCSVSWAGDRVCLLQTIANVSLLLPPVDASDLAADLLKRIEEFNMHLTEVDAHVKALSTLCKQKAASSQEGEELIRKWVQQLLSGAHNVLESYMSKELETAKGSSFFTPSSGKGKGKHNTASSKLLSQAITAVFTVGSLVLVCPSADLHGIVPLLHAIITSGKPGSGTIKLANFTVSANELDPSLCIQSWVAMGKICLVDDKLAKRYIPLFLQELEKSDCAALRNNILVVMIDFCVRYTALVDCYIPKITMTLRDPCEVVRRQTFILLSRLLQRDYVKWRGVLFLRFLLSLVDESQKIRNLADYLFGNILKAKAPLLAYNSFVEAIFFLNGCNARYGRSEAFEKGSRRFTISGSDDKARSQRMHIYVSLLKQMAPEHLLATSAKLCAEILAAASDGMLSIDDATGQSVVQDTLHILACKEMRIQSSKSQDTAEIDDECGESGESSALLAAKGRLVTQVAKKNLVQHAVPIFIELKRLLESKNSPLTGSLLRVPPRPSQGPQERNRRDPRCRQTAPEGAYLRHGEV
ncbi:hypothetical protein HPP92_015972 [Vanilla planifolia]|uniref:Condensin complex subunit 1 C-terminal domain-containing protein n=1 Tax=Vanilla planifolia TaxID=51239 RepID=A0A835UVL7_VANPL|nr:hypothetical protein HPP92_015972 [Vanilla planifolia]